MGKIFPFAVGLLACTGMISQTLAAKQCMGCVVVSSLLERNAILRENDVQRTANTLCDSIFDPTAMEGFNVLCKGLLSPMVPSLQEALDNGLSPDDYCKDVLNYCDGTCVLYDEWPVSQDKETYQVNALNREFMALTKPRAKVSALSQEYVDFMAYFFDRTAAFLRFSMDDEPSYEDNQLYEKAKHAAEKLGYSALYKYLGSLTGLKNGYSSSEYNATRNELLSILGKMNPQYTKFPSNASKSYADYLKEIQAGSISAESDTCDNLKGGFLYPIPDNDQDHFGSANLFRGADWRGKDCNDSDSTIYPGRSQTSHSSDVDHNCNGIFGTDRSGHSYEDLLCSAFTQYGVLAVGDSATAHFAVPARWFGTSDDNGWNDLLSVVLHEADFPQCSTYTGFNPDSCADSFNDKSITLKSIYQRVVERNACSFRDYQNLGINGNSMTRASPNSHSSTVTYITRSKIDHPALVFISLIGNDICSKRPDVESMTSVEDYEQSLRDTLEYIDTVVPPKSYVFIGGLVDGRILYDYLSNSIHPFGVKFSQVYNFLNCLETSPCAGWLNSDPQIREAASAHARSLSKIAKYATTFDFKNFKAYYYDNASYIHDIIFEYDATGKDATKLIEPFDGFHPSGITQALLAEKVWEFVTSTVDIPTNPFNSRIKDIFGDQGGYY